MTSLIRDQSLHEIKRFTGLMMDYHFIPYLSPIFRS